MTAIEPPTPSAALLRLALEALRTSACILLHSLQLMQSCESLLPWPFLTLSGQKFFYSYRNMNQGCSVSWATFGERGFIFSAFVWRSKYLGEAEDSFPLKHVCTSLEQQAGSRGLENRLPFPCLPASGLPLTQRVHMHPHPWGCSLTPALPCKIQLIFQSNDWNTVYKIMAFFHLKKKYKLTLHLKVIFKPTWLEATFSHNWNEFFFS